MYERCQYDWTPLCAGDPIPGSPDVLDRSAATFRTNAANIGQAIANLARLDCREENYSVAILKIMEKADSVAISLTEVQERYRTLSTEVTGYATTLRQSQATSLRALERATEAARRKNEAWRRIAAAQPGTLSIDQAVRDQAVYDHNRAVTDLRGANGEVASARALLQAAIQERDAAAEKAASRIHEEIDSSSINDTVSDHVANVIGTIGTWVATGLKWIWDHIDTICLVLDVISLVLLATGVAAPAGAFLKGLTLTVSALSKGAKVLQLVKKSAYFGSSIAEAQRTGQWGPVVSAGGSLAIAGVGFAGGKFLNATAAQSFAPGFAKAGAAASTTSKLQQLQALSQGSGQAGQVLSALRSARALETTARTLTPSVMGDGIEAGFGLSMDAATDLFESATGIEADNAVTGRRADALLMGGSARRTEVSYQ